MNSPPTITMQKRRLRETIRRRLAARSGPRILEKSAAVARRLFETQFWPEADWVFGFVSMSGEIETRAMIRRAFQDGKKVAIPRMEDDDLAFYQYAGNTEDLLPNQFGILEPDPVWLYIDPARLKDQVLLVLTPGLSFDRQMRRLGRGKGYYDRFLKRARANRAIRVRAVGLGFSEQLIAEVPVNDYDQPLDGLITDLEIIV